MNQNNLEALFKPENIAIVGASGNPAKAGYVILQNLIRKKYPKKIYPVNPGEKEILGLKSYARLSEIKDTVELVVLITPSKMIFSVMEDLDRRMQEKNDVKAIVCAAADYGETKTEEGIRRQEALISTATKYNIRVVGPNCIGVIDNESMVDTTFVETGVPEARFGPRGGVSFISQSGAIAASILMIGASQALPVRFNKFISIGNMADVDFIDLLEYLEHDDTTRVIGMYMEGYRDGRRLIDTMARIVKKKPIVVLKVGRSEKGASAANSHTGSLAGSDRVYDAAFRQYGITRVESIDELMDTLQAFDKLALPQSENLFVLSQAGGPGIFCTDAVSKYPFVKMPGISGETRKKLKESLPPMAVVCVPEGYADITASATVTNHAQSLQLLLEDDKVGGIILITVIPTFLPKKELAQALVNTYSNSRYKYEKPVYFVIMAGDYVKDIRETLERAGICTFDTPDRAVNAAKNMIKYHQYLEEQNSGGECL
jgi:acyl-CoA synthetase (NDP forming)